MKSHRRTNFLELTFVLILLGILVGAVGGAAVGFITGRAPSSSAGQ